MLWIDFITRARETMCRCVQLAAISFSNTKGNQRGRQICARHQGTDRVKSQDEAREHRRDETGE